MGDQEAEVDRILRLQDGVITKAQVMEVGPGRAYFRRQVRRRAWVAVYPGVCVNHTGPLTWRQRAWCAVLDAQPAALSHRSALRAANPKYYQGRDDEPIHIVVDASRRVPARPGIVVHYSRHFGERALMRTHPPRMRLEEAALDVAAAGADDLEAIAVLADVVQARTTTADRLIAALDRRMRMPRRKFLRDVLLNVRDGTCSVLEHEYLTKVERAHGLPKGIRQTPTESGRSGFRDVEYPELDWIVELDGRLCHDNARARDLDMERDLDAAAFEKKRSQRLGYGQVFGRACSTAAKLGRIFRDAGWTGHVKRCGPDCGI
ncbi:hypothetical protein ACH46_17005 [Gordonia phthalatica]|uniref:AbiEi antitoxin C-terminal domain-containing protein n=2 Tax=Gordonia phthalatica TaxID=1136941 RepID=A0A0N9NDV8_9ACTN|nr:hypothetical protein ACH46_17005 [Gordonia phthalatica]